MTAACSDEVGGTVNLVLPKFTPHSFASLPEAFCTALNVISTLLRALETLHSICQVEPQKLEQKYSSCAPESSTVHAEHPEQKLEDQTDGAQEERHAVFPAGPHRRSFREEHREILCQVGTVLQQARFLNCNAEQYSHLLAPGEAATESTHAPSIAALPQNIEEDISHSSIPGPRTRTEEEQRLSVNSSRRQMCCSIQHTASNQPLCGENTSGETAARTNTTCDEKNQSQYSRRAGVAERSEKSFRRRSSRGKGDSTLNTEYELSVCKALLMLQQLDTSKGNRCWEDDVFFSLEHQIQQRQLAVCDTPNYTTLQRETFYNLLQREVLKHQAPMWPRHEQETLWYGSAPDTRSQHQPQRKWCSPSLQSVLSGGPCVKLDKAILLELLLRIKMLQECQRVLRADIIMMRHQHYRDRQTLRRTLQETTAAYGVEKKALLSRLQKLADLLQSK